MTAGALCLLTLACGSGGPTETSGPELSELSLFPDRITAVVGDFVELQVTALDLAGVELPDFEPTYTSSDPNVVSIGPDNRIVPTGAGTATVRAAAGGQTAEAVFYVGGASYDIETQGPPHVLSANYIDLSKIAQISRFRSAIGHSYSFGNESCRSMKHYYQPMASADWTSVDIYAPASGTIQGVRPDGAAGYQIRMAPKDLPWLSILIFHVAVDPGIVLQTWVEAGDHLGTHASFATMSDIAMSLGPAEDGGQISYFQAMTDAVFAEYEVRGVASREAAIITEEERNADPVMCTGEAQFTDHGTIENWLYLN